MNKRDIKKWLKRYCINNYTINDDLTVDVNGNVDLSKRGINKLPIQFGVVNGYFYISRNNLKSLKGCPYVVKGWFGCSENPLLSLEYLPIIYGDMITDVRFLDNIECKKYSLLRALRR